MDDHLEHPHVVAKPLAPQELHEDHDEHSSGDEDEGPDWTKLPTVARPVIPKRGEKDFEPNVSGGSGLQRHVLDGARSAMFDALKTTRTTSSKSMSYAVWHSDIARAHVTTARGIHFSNMGHSVARVTLAGLDDMPKIPKRLELLPEEALYLVERGAMFCWKASELPVAGAPAFEDMEGEPMTVQQAFAEMIGTEDLTLEKYQVFAYLKRLGYVVTRTRPPSEAYPASAPFPPHPYPRVSFLRWILSCLTSPLKRLLNTFTGAFDWWKPLRFNRWLHHNMSYPSIYKSLRFLPSGHKEPLYIKTPFTPSPYQIFFNLYKPSTSFKKTAPPAPDFSMVVVNARTTVMPSLSELNDLFGSLPELPPPVPRRRTLLPQKPAPLPTPAVQPKSFLQRIFPWAFPTLPQGPVARKTNPFAVLKAGTKMVVVAVVDAGTISFFRFGPGAFEDFPMN